MLDYFIILIIGIYRIKGNLRRGYKLAIILGMMMIVNFICYAVLFELNIFDPPQRSDNLKYLFSGIAIADVLLLIFIRKVLFRHLHKANKMSREDLIERLIIISVITDGLCECIVLIGLLLSWITKISSAEFYIFLIVGLLFFGIYFPRYGQWEEWAKLQEAKNMSTT